MLTHRISQEPWDGKWRQPKHEINPIFIETPPILTGTGCGQDPLILRSNVVSQVTIPHEWKASMAVRSKALASPSRREDLGDTDGDEFSIEVGHFCQHTYDE